MNKLFSVLIVCISAVSLVFTQQKEDKKAKNLLQKTSKNYVNQNILLEFNYTVESKTGGKESEKGSFKSSRNKYEMRALGVTQIFDGKKLYSISKEDQEVTVSEPEFASEGITNPTDILEHYKKNYDIKYSGKSSLNGTSVEWVTLLPKKKSKTKEIMVAIHPTKFEMLQLKETSNKGVVTTISFTKFEKNKKFNKNDFRFVKDNYKNYTITYLD